MLVVLNVLVNAPNLSPLYFEGAVFWCFLITVYLGIYAVFRYAEIIPINYGGIPRFSLEFTGRQPQKALYPDRCAVGTADPGVGAFLAAAGSKAYRDQLGDPEVRTFSSDIQVLDQSELPIVDQALAANLADKKLASAPHWAARSIWVNPPSSW